MCRRIFVPANCPFLRCSLIALLLILLPAAVHAQAVSIASVTGRVVDEQGAVVSGAQIRMIAVDTGVVSTTLSNADGIYAFPSLPIGAYRLESTVSGFQTYVHRFAKNYTFLANYTWSKCLGIAPVTSLGNPGVVQNPNNVRGDYGPCTYDVPHLMNVSVVYLSKFSGSRLPSHLLSNWTVAPLARYQSGLPVNPVAGKDNSLRGVNNDRPDLVSGQNAYTGAPHGLSYQYVNPKLYTPNMPGTFGNADHNSLRGPGYFDVDLAATREFHLMEKLTLHARGEAFNILNHPNFGLPNGNTASAAFGQITTAFDPRILQGSMKLVF